MAKNLIDISVDTNKITALGKKLSRYGPVAIKAGLEAATDYLNDPDFMFGMYPPEVPSGTPFEWSSEAQRKKVMALLTEQGGPPYQRTYELLESGSFSINAGSLWIEYENVAPYSRFVMHPSYMIKGHRARGWKPVNQFVVAKSKDVARVFEKAAKAAWDEQEKFLFGGGAGL